jgi:tetratricopeptide (TPR) repeat protein
MSVDDSARPHGDRRWGDAIDLSNRRSYLRQRRRAQADLNVARLLGDQVAESNARLELGRALLSLGYIDEAMAELTTVTDQAEAAGNLDCLYKALYSLAAAHLALNRREDHLACRRRGLAIAQRIGNLIEVDYATALVGYALLYLGQNEEAHEYLRRSEEATHGLMHGCKRAGMGVTQAMAKVNRLNLLDNVTARVYVLSWQKRWQEAHSAIQDGLAASEMVDSYITERLMTIADGLSKNGF